MKVLPPGLGWADSQASSPAGAPPVPTSPALTCTGRHLSGNLSSTTWHTGLHTLMVPQLQVNACLGVLLTAVPARGPHVTAPPSPFRVGRPTLWDCQGKAFCFFHVSLKSSGSQHLGRRGFGVTNLPMSPSSQ